MNELVLKTVPIFFKKIWGGRRIYDDFNLAMLEGSNPNGIGEVWGISGYLNGDNYIKGLNKPISTWWNEIGNSGNFPYQIRIVDANERLSIQVHPDRDINYNNMSYKRKNEAWYILDCLSDAKIVYNTKVKNQSEILKMIDSNKFDELINYKPIRKNELIYIPAGMVHAITDKTLLLEIAECSDTTFRLYDYNRTDKYGNSRELHIEESKKVLNYYPTVEYGTLGKQVDNNWEKETLLNNGIFNIEIVRCFKTITLNSINAGSGFFVINGNCLIENETFKKGEFGIITVTSIDMYGEFELLLVRT